MRSLLLAAALLCASFANDTGIGLKNTLERYKAAQAAINGDKEELRTTVLATFCGQGPQTSEEKETIMSRAMFIRRALELSEAQETYRREYIDVLIRHTECIITAVESKDFTLPCVAAGSARRLEVAEEARAAGLTDAQIVDARRAFECIEMDLWKPQEAGEE